MLQSKGMETIPTVRSRPSLGLSLVLGLLLAVIILALGLFVLPSLRNDAPREGSAEVGFARDMATHHAQAVDMATLLRDRSDDEAMRTLALDITLTQQAQIGQMQGWLAVWGLPNARIEPAMTWMNMPTRDRMPGMASPEDLNQLRDLTGTEADGLFLNLMIVHHRAGVEMAQAVLDRTERPEVRALAQSMVNAQQNEIDYMQTLLQEKGFPPVPDAPVMNHDGM